MGNIQLLLVLIFGFELFLILEKNQFILLYNQLFIRSLIEWDMRQEFLRNEEEGR